MKSKIVGLVILVLFSFFLPSTYIFPNDLGKSVYVWKREKSRQGWYKSGEKYLVKYCDYSVTLCELRKGTSHLYRTWGKRNTVTTISGQQCHTWSMFYEYGTVNIVWLMDGMIMVEILDKTGNKNDIRLYLK